MPKTFRNPILPGFYPDPSVCRVGDDYFLVNSTFEFFPGLPIHHSRDLVHWRQIGHVLDRPEQLNLDGVRPSGGLYAPTIRHHEGTFYVINTMVDGPGREGQEGRSNFIVTAPDPAGPWSTPHWLDDAPGIDPSLLFDDDGRAWYVGNRHAFDGHYDGHCEIWLQELDLEEMQLIGPRTVLWDGAVKGAVYAEGPHLYRIDGRYYLMIAEGGTGHDHAVTIARSETITGPYEVNPRNPILTHRHLGQGYPIVGTGHADLVQTQYGEWWLLALAMRPYDGYFYNLGRETFMAPVRWEEGWPIVSPGTGKIEESYLVPNLPEHRWPAEPVTDHFETDTLDHRWNYLRTPREPILSLSDRPGFLRLYLRPATVAERANPGFLGRRQQHINFSAIVSLEFTPANPSEEAGLVLLQNDDYHFRFVLGQSSSGMTVRLIKRFRGSDTVIAEHALDRDEDANSDRLYLRVEAQGQAYSFCVARRLGDWITIARQVDGRLLSTPVAGGFIGAYIGLYASSNGQAGTNHVDVDWFEYKETN